MTDTAPAQGSGTIKGSVRDKTSKENLPGANIVLKGTSIGAASGPNGEYIIHSVPSGTQTVVASYVGSFHPGDRHRKRHPSPDFDLASTVIEGKKSSSRAGAGTTRAINQQLSNKIVNVVSGQDPELDQRPGRLPAAGRFSAQSPGGNKVRSGACAAIQHRHRWRRVIASTAAPISGSPATPTLSSRRPRQERRSHDGHAVHAQIDHPHKSLTPDMNANAVGRVVNITPRGPAEAALDVLWQSGYVDKSKSYGNYRFVASGATAIRGQPWRTCF
jgi:hypothetical protein